MAKRANRAAGSAKTVRNREPLHEFTNNVFRDKFYQILGHHYVLDLRDTTLKPKADQPSTATRFIRSLGVSDTQLGRWKAEKTFVAADHFFAFQTLVTGERLYCR